MNRLDEAVGTTPKARKAKQGDAPAKDSITKSGRKIKRPAHLDTVESAASEADAQREKPTAETGAATPGKRALLKQETPQKDATNSRKATGLNRTADVSAPHTPKRENENLRNAAEDSPGISKSGRKIKIPHKLMEFESEILSSPRKSLAPRQEAASNNSIKKPRGRPLKSATKQTARDEIEQADDSLLLVEGVATKKNAALPSKTVTSSEIEQSDDSLLLKESIATKKTPARRQKSVASSEIEQSDNSLLLQENVATKKIPARRPKSVAPSEIEQSDDSLLLKESVATKKTPARRPKSVAPSEIEQSDESLLPKENVATKKTPARRPKSVAHSASGPEAEAESTVKTARTTGRRGGKLLADNVTETPTLDEIPSKLPGPRTTKSTINLEVKTKPMESPAPKQSATKTPGRRGKSIVPINADETDQTKETAATDNKNAKGVGAKDTSNVVKATQTPGSRGKNVTSEAKPLKTPGRRAKSVVEALTIEEPNESGKLLSQNEEPMPISAPELQKTQGRRAMSGSKAPANEPMQESKSAVKAARVPVRKLGRVDNPAAQSRDEMPSDEPKLSVDEPLSRSGRKIKVKKIFGAEEEPLSPRVNVNIKEHETPNGGRKRKSDTTDDEQLSLKSPSKKKTTEENAIPEQSGQPSNMNNRVALGSSPGDNQNTPSTVASDDTVVSRSGRKIKPKKMFGYEDGESSPVVHVTGSSSAAFEPTDGTQAKEKKTVTTPVKTVTRMPVKVVSDLAVKKGTEHSPTTPKASVAKMIATPSLPFITKRAVDNHHHRQLILAPSAPIDEPDRAMAGNMNDQAVIIRTSIGFGRPTATMKKVDTSLQSAESTKEKNSPKSTVCATSKQDPEQQTPSSRSGRKIKPKKFFDTDETVTSPARLAKESKPMEAELLNTPPMKISTVGSNALAKKAASPAGLILVANEPSQTTTIVEEAAIEQAAEADEGVDIAEGPVKLPEADEPMSDVTVKDQEATEAATPAATSTEEKIDDLPCADLVMDSMEQDSTNILKCDEATGEVNVIVPSELMEDTAGSSMLVDTAQTGTSVSEAGIPSTQELHLEPIASDLVSSTLDGDDQGFNFDGSETKHVEEAVQRVRSPSPKQPESSGQTEKDELVRLGEVTKAPTDQPMRSPSPKLSETTEQTTKEKVVELSNVEVTKASEDMVKGVCTNTRNESAVFTDEPGAVLNSTTQDESNASLALYSESEPKLHNLSSESTIAELKVDDDDELQETSYGSIEYLEEEVGNIVEHLRKPADHDDHVIPTITIIPETPAANKPWDLNQTFSPVKSNPTTSTTSSVPVIDITSDTPRPAVGAAAPRTPESKSATRRQSSDKCSPDKPPEVIEILDSPAVAAFCKQINDVIAMEGGTGGSASSTPLPVKPILAVQASKPPSNDIPFEGRKRSLSASAADTTMKRNVTFHSPANCTVFVDTIDERLMLKGLQQQQQQEHESKDAHLLSTAEKVRKPRKRSLSEHKPTEGHKPSKISKIPNFKNIHEQHFKNMESIADFMKRKEKRAKNILSSASPATKMLSRAVTERAGMATETLTEKKGPVGVPTKPFVFKFGGGAVPAPKTVLFSKKASTASHPQVVKDTDTTGRSGAATESVAASSVAKKPIPSDTERMAYRLKQFQATYKSKQQVTASDTDTVPGNTVDAATTKPTDEHPVQKLRAKQLKIIKGVRTNRRFELQMKHRDNLQHQ